MAHTLVPVQLDLDAVADGLDLTTISDEDRDLIRSQGLPGGKEMFIAATPDAIRKAKLRYVRAMLLGTESPPPRPRTILRVRGNNHIRVIGACGEL